MGVGRPRLEITAEQLEYLFGYELTFRDVAEALGVPESTVKRRAREHGITLEIGDQTRLIMSWMKC